MISGFNKALAHLSNALRGDARDRAAASTATHSKFDRAPNWHGDHWQNLLSSPMDARRYILEDWNDTVESVHEDDGLPRIDSFSGRLVQHYN
jgi:hypothetical protein